MPYNTEDFAASFGLFVPGKGVTRMFNTRARCLGVNHGRILWAGSLILMITALLPAIAHAQRKTSQTEDPLPPARTRYMGRQIAQTMTFHGAAWLIRSERESEERPSEALAELNLKPGMTVCDLGCGNGYYSLAMAKQVAPDGKVLAVDIQPEMLHLLELRSKEMNVQNIEPILGTPADPKLPANSVDLLLLVDVYHEFSHPVQMLAGIRESLKPKGLVALLEYREEDKSVPIKPLHKMSKKQILKEYTANGFKLARQYDELPWQHLMFFERDENWKPKALSKPEDE